VQAFERLLSGGPEGPHYTGAGRNESTKEYYATAGGLWASINGDSMSTGCWAGGLGFQFDMIGRFRIVANPASAPTSQTINATASQRAAPDGASDPRAPGNVFVTATR
jgi:hypothetical protein